MKPKNRNHYINMDPLTLDHYSRISGIFNGEDLKHIHHLINFQSIHKKIFDLGCGTGRAIDYLLRNNFKGEIFGIDSNKPFIDEAQKRIKSSQVTLNNMSFFNLNLSPYKKRFNYSFLLFSTISEFNNESRRILFKNLCDMTEEYIFVDFIEDISESNVTKLDDETLYSKGDWGEYYGFYFNQNNCKEIESEHECSLVDIISYTTSTNKPRKIAIFKPL